MKTFILFVALMLVCSTQIIQYGNTFDILQFNKFFGLQDKARFDIDGFMKHFGIKTTQELVNFNVQGLTDSLKADAQAQNQQFDAQGFKQTFNLYSQQVQHQFNIEDFKKTFSIVEGQTEQKFDVAGFNEAFNITPNQFFDVKNFIQTFNINQDQKGSPQFNYDDFANTFFTQTPSVQKGVNLPSNSDSLPQNSNQNTQQNIVIENLPQKINFDSENFDKTFNINNSRVTLSKEIPPYQNIIIQTPRQVSIANYAVIENSEIPRIDIKSQSDLISRSGVIFIESMINPTNNLRKL